MSESIVGTVPGHLRSQSHEFDATFLVAALCSMFGLEEVSYVHIDELMEREFNHPGHYYQMGLLRLGFNLIDISGFDFERALREGLSYIQSYEERRGVPPTMTTQEEYERWAMRIADRCERLRMNGPGVFTPHIVDELTIQHLTEALQQGPVVTCVDWNAQDKTYTLALGYIYNGEFHIYEPSVGDRVSSISELWSMRVDGSTIMRVSR